MAEGRSARGSLFALTSAFCLQLSALYLAALIRLSLIIRSFDRKGALMRIAAAVLLFATSVLAQAPAVAPQTQPLKLTIDTIMSGPALTGYEPRDLRWSPDGKAVYFSWKQRNEPVEKDFDTYVVNRDGSGLRKLSDEEEKNAPPVRAVWTRDRKRAVFVDNGDVFIWANGKRRQITNTEDAESKPRFTQDERRLTLVRDNNLFVVSLDDGMVAQMTNIVGAEDKTPLWDERKGTPNDEWIKSEERKLIETVDRRAKQREEEEAKKKREHPIKPLKLEKKQSIADLQLSPDGKYVIVAITSEADKVKRTIVPNYVTESGYTDTIQGREKAGDILNVTRIGVISTANGEVKWFESGLKATPTAAVAQSESKHETKEKESATERMGTQDRTAAAAVKERAVSYGPVRFSDDGTKAFVTLRAADNKDWWLFAFDPANAKGRVLATVHDDAWVRRMFRNTGWLSDSEHIWFLSEATGWAHLYVVPFSGGEPQQLTSGKWEVEDADISDDRKSFILTTSEVSPYERHVYRMPLTGGARVKLTSAPGRHDAVPSPDGAVLADVYSYTNKPPEVYIGTKQVTTSPAPEFFTYPWEDVPITTYTASDGAQVPVQVFKPVNWKPGGPAVVFVHGAGYAQNVDRWWGFYSREYMFHHFLMEHGYIVLNADYRASAGYGRDWRTAIYRHMGGRDLQDEVDAAKYLVDTYGVDPKKIGMYGGSYGGFMTLMAMFTAPGVFASGAALRPVTDWAAYNHPYTSDILNTPVTDAQAYRQSSPIYFADGLKGNLLICHGVVDTNVHFQDTVRLVQRLIELHKDNWNIAIYPMENHGFVDADAWTDEYKRIFKLFESTLK